MTYFFTADEHYNHDNVLSFMKRPFNNIEEMNNELVKRNNEIVGKDDFVIHAGDFCWKGNADFIRDLHKKLIGNHVFLRGSHDNWMNGSYSMGEPNYDLVDFFDLLATPGIFIIDKNHKIIARQFPLSKLGEIFENYKNQINN